MVSFVVLLGSGVSKKKLHGCKLLGLENINPLVPSVPKNGTPTLTVHREIIHVLMG